MRQEEVNLQPQSDEEQVVSSIDEDIVENFARQLDEVVRIQEEEEDMESEEENDMFGYQPLPQGDDDDDEDMEYSQLHSDDEQDVRDPPSIEIDESNKLAPETTDLIKSIMSNIQLSDEAIPEWAKQIPEQAWLPRLKKQE